MDAVKAFNTELSSLYEVKPPISKAKMTALTRGAIKAIKFYKHVVQSVEKFILKCKPEYKVPGLYVIDSIVRQSRHQFGSDKDVFAPRFAKNMQQTFVNLFKCPAEDKSKVIRVLNLWQKNQVFAPDVIQPLFDLADPNHPIHKELNNMSSNGLPAQNLIGNMSKGSPALQKTPTKIVQGTTDTTHSSGLNNVPTNFDPNALAQLQQLHRMLLRQQQQGDSASKVLEGPPIHFDRKLLDFDYGSDEEEPNNPSPKIGQNNSSTLESVGSLLSNPEVLRQLQTLQQSITTQNVPEFDLEKLRKLQEMKQQEEEFDKHLAQTVPNLPFASECEFKPSTTNSPAILPGYFLPAGTDLSQPPPGYKPQCYDMTQSQEDGTVESEVEFVGTNDNDVEIINLDHSDSRTPSPRDRYNRHRKSRSRDRSRDRRDRRSRRSRSRSRSRSRRHRTRSRERDREREREREKEREKEKERKKRGLPPIKKDNLSVCSTTLWVGHLSKLVHQEELSDTFGEFGDIVSIDLILPRGCAFIVMHRRQDAARCLTKLKNHKMQGKAITLAWAPGKGVKGKDLKDYWEGDLGVSYIPWSKLKPDIDIEMLEDGGMVDEDTMPAWMKAKMAQSNTTKPLQPPPSLLPAIDPTTGTIQLPERILPTPTTVVDTSQPPPVPAGSLLQPPPLTLPLVNPFQLNNRLLGSVGMNHIPPGIMPNVPIGVPPPNLAGGPLMPNQLLGLGSPFQGPPGLMQQQQSLPQLAMPTTTATGTSSGGNNEKTDQNQSNIVMQQEEALLSITHQPFGGIVVQQALQPPQPNLQQNSQQDDMDVEMEEDDDSKTDQQQHNLSHHNRSNLTNQRVHNPSSGVSNEEHQRDAGGSGMIDRRDRRNRSRDRDRDRDNRRDRGRRNSRDRNRDRERDSSRGGGERRGDDRRDRNNRWGDRERRDRDRNEREDRRDREKALNDRLREMAGMEGSQINDRNDDLPQLLLERPPMFPDFNNGEPPDTGGREIEGDRFRRGGGAAIDNYDNRIRRDYPPTIMDRSEFDSGDYDGPRPLLHRDNILDERFMRRDRFGDDLRMIEDFDRMRGPPPPGPDFYPPPPRDSFGPPRPMMRPGPDGFPPRPMMGRPPGPHMFHPRGPHMRGPRPGPWMDGGMRPSFPPRFDGPPDFFRGPPRMHFDDQFARLRREDGRRMPFDSSDHGPDMMMDRSERRSRWGNTSPKGNDYNNKSGLTSNIGKEQNNNTSNSHQQSAEEQHEEQSFKSNDKDDSEEILHGSTTPLHDEPQDGLNNSSNGNKSSSSAEIHLHHHNNNQQESESVITTMPVNDDIDQEQKEDVVNESESIETTDDN